MSKFLDIIGGPAMFPSPQVKLANGHLLSVQVGERMYCTPRNNKGPYTHVEVGAWHGLPAQFDAYHDGPVNEPQGDDLRVYGYVPAELVRAYINACGGEK